MSSKLTERESVYVWLHEPNNCHPISLRCNLPTQDNMVTDKIKFMLQGPESQQRSSLSLSLSLSLSPCLSHFFQLRKCFFIELEQWFKWKKQMYNLLGDCTAQRETALLCCVIQAEGSCVVASTQQYSSNKPPIWIAQQNDATTCEQIDIFCFADASVVNIHVR